MAGALSNTKEQGRTFVIYSSSVAFGRMYYNYTAFQDGEKIMKLKLALVNLVTVVGVIVLFTSKSASDNQ